MKRILVYGTFDLFHYGHLELLKKAKEISNNGVVIVGVASDEYALKKGQKTIFNEKERREIIKSIKYVDDVFINDSPFEHRLQQILDNKIDLVIVDEKNIKYFDYLKDICEVGFFPRTPNISTTKIKEVIKNVQ